jgi:hypothetical protein
MFDATSGRAGMTPVRAVHRSDAIQGNDVLAAGKVGLVAIGSYCAMFDEKVT